MKKVFIAICAVAALVSCRNLKDEWDPVFSDPDNGAFFVPYTQEQLEKSYGLKTITSIKDLKAKYTGGPIVVSGNTWIKGQVVSSDRTGNIYKEIYLQDATGAIDLKMGKNNMYVEYLQGQWVYVKCDGLTLGAYNGMPQLGFASDNTPSNEYDTSYIDLQPIIDQHVFRGFVDTPVKPLKVTEAQITTSVKDGFQGELWGKLVTIEGLQYGAPTQYATDTYKRIFIFLNIDPYKDKKATFNRMRLSTGTYGINTWALSKSSFIAHLDAGDFDSAQNYDGLPMDAIFDNTDLTLKETLRANATGVATSQYFHLGNTAVQIRTSGFAKFADVEIDPKIIGDLNAQDGALFNATGILTVYDGGAQLVLVDEPSVSVVLQ